MKALQAYVNACAAVLTFLALLPLMLPLMFLGFTAALVVRGVCGGWQAGQMFMDWVARENL